MLAPLPLPRSRLEALTDGIFAVSMTLLVLDLRFPAPEVVDRDGLSRTLLALRGDRLRREPGRDLVLEALMWRYAMRNLANETVLDAAAVWHVAGRRFLVAIGIVVAGMLVAIAEIALRIQSGIAPYVYLLLIGAGIVRRARR